ncbi:MAG: hypothetical protein JXQ30_08715 [Spirochaetes bacterium]|nr:hypothetical protein [Spirochaetota bacterium]
MADPLTAAFIMVGTTLNIAGTGLQANAQRRAYEAAAEQAEKDAAYVEEQTEKAVQRYREEGEEFQGRQRAIIGASGSTFEGSPLMIYEKTTRQMEEDILQIREQGKHEAERLRSQAGQYSEMATQTAVSSLFSMGQTFISGAYDAYKLTPGSFKQNYVNKAYRYQGLRFPG